MLTPSSLSPLLFRRFTPLRISRRQYVVGGRECARARTPYRVREQKRRLVVVGMEVEVGVW